MSTKRATTLRLIRNIDFDANYKDVVLFNSPEEQTEYFYGLIGKEFEEHSYQRIGSGYIKIKDTMSGSWRYCYLMFKNNSHEDKWWYAFIDSVDYINDTTVGIRFHLDVMQSYMFDYTLGHSFVVREHSETDTPGDNIVPENIYYGVYEYDEPFDQLEVDASECPFNFSGKLTANDMAMVIAYNPAMLDLLGAISDLFGFVWKENLYGGVYQGIRFVALPFTDKLGKDKLKDMIAELDKFFGSADALSSGGIVSIFMMPIIFLPDKDNPSWDNVRRGISYDPPTYFPGFTPKNQKLFTYPYVAMNVSNMRTPGNDYPYEYFINRKPSFCCEGTLSVNPSCICYPIGYRGKTFALDEGVTIDNYPLATWGEDGITEWVSNHLFQTAIGLGLTAAAVIGAPAFASVAPALGSVGASAIGGGSSAERSLVVGSRSGPPSTTLATPSEAAPPAPSSPSWRPTLSSSTRELIGTVTMAAGTPPVAHGVNAHDLLFGNPFGRSIRFRRKHITTEYARKLDAYFTKYGYAVNEVKKPNLKSRPYWNYVELKNPHLEDINFPMRAVQEIEDVYERGVTFWRPHARIGDYESQNNTV